MTDKSENFLTFTIYPLTKNFRKKIWNFLGGYPHFCPPKPVPDQKWPPMTPYDPPILMQNPFLHKKWGCFQKTRAPYLEKWPRYGHVKFAKRNLKISEKIDSAEKNCDNSVNFWDIVKFFFAYGHWWLPLKVRVKFSLAEGLWSIPCVRPNCWK